MGTYPDRTTVEELRDSALAALAESITNRQPSYDQDGQKVSWTEYRAGLQKTLDWATEMLIKIGQSEDPGGEETTML